MNDGNARRPAVEFLCGGTLVACYWLLTIVCRSYFVNSDQVGDTRVVVDFRWNVTVKATSCRSRRCRLKHKLIHILAPSIWICVLGSALDASRAISQQALTWDQVKANFEAANPALKADADNVDEMRAEEITAFLRPNPQLTVSVDGSQVAPKNGVWTPLKGTTEQPNFSYLHERAHKRELRLKSAQEGTRITQSQHEDLKRNMVFALRAAFVGTLQAKFILELAKADLEYYDKIIDISRSRFKAGDLAQIDLDRIELLRVQYESEIETATVDLRTAKIQLLQMLNDRTPLDRFDVTGPFEFSDALQPLETYRDSALTARPDLQAALQTVQQSVTNHKLAVADGSTDPTFAGWFTNNSSTNNPNGSETIGASVSIPLRIFDRNQGRPSGASFSLKPHGTRARVHEIPVTAPLSVSHPRENRKAELISSIRAELN